MFSVNQKRQIADAVQGILRDTGHPELPDGEIQFHSHSPYIFNCSISTLMVPKAGHGRTFATMAQ